ncbi:uncharacterized protein SPAPADRAFT_146854 [Spathaspora passalidarum NRRL Y-27907]|uniref:FAD-binding FR-type domain-containing protein n=1 Tax=Spathaspora passalidarum (strain NRRL Y-27907 / 11-Y1) TaxID=619300 RepID=G3AH86_SPAPN|nr:uncharacterized protein SPAPADRAFT_146854 [Spathaspora passalidarum NRRL Y-27907]EGW35516.1 hypothetical protein SPAPADRAFT_146854 [Spathaspora passalidarum NRRL Y-27907]
MKILCLVFIFAIGALAHGSGLEFYKQAAPLYGCNYIISYTGYHFCPPTDKTCLCTNENSVATIAGCLANTNSNTTYVVDHFVPEYCHEYYLTELEPDWYNKALEYFNKNARNASEVEATETPIDFPIRFEQAELERYQATSINYFNNRDDSIWYGVALFGFWLVVLIIAAVSHWSKILFPGFIKKMTGPISNFWRKYISAPALLGKRKAQFMPGFKVLDSLIPSRYESIVVALFYIVTIITQSINLKAIENDPVYGTKYAAEMRYVGDRTGIVGTIIMPLVMLFAGRNNFLQWLCGINYATFLCYHRHIARVMFMLVVVHSVTYSIFEEEYYYSDFKQPWFYWGVIATTIGGFMLIQSILYLRRYWYEMFLFIHIVFAAVYIAGTWIHIVNLGYGIILYPSVAVWCFDRLVRLCRLTYFGFPESTLTLVGNETIKVTIPKPRYWSPIPGGHAFIHFIKPTYFWQSHPFTFTSSAEENNIVMYIKLKGGVTHSLYKLLNKSPGKTMIMRVGVEGPYGEATPAKYSDKAVFIAGGNGIPGIYSEIYDIGLRAPKASKQVLKLIWVIRDYASISWFHEELKTLQNTNIDITIYVTRPSNFSKIEESNSSKEGSIKSSELVNSYESVDVIEQLKELSHIHFKEGRPNLEQLVQDEVKDSPGSIAFVVCGHPIMVDEVRYQCVKNIGNPEKKRVDFYEQLQVWA